MGDDTMTLERRFCRFKKRLAALERRFAALEENMERLLSLVMRIAERQGVRE
jgi:hypothetical protein